MVCFLSNKLASCAYCLSLFLYLYFYFCRENEVLKVQLKKYVGAVQMLKREGSQGNDGKAMFSYYSRA